MAKRKRLIRKADRREEKIDSLCLGPSKVAHYAETICHRYSILREAADRDIRWPRHWLEKRYNVRLPEGGIAAYYPFNHKNRVCRLLDLWYPNRGGDEWDVMQDQFFDAVAESTEVELDRELCPLLHQFRDEYAKLIESASAFFWDWTEVSDEEAKAAAKGWMSYRSSYLHAGGTTDPLLSQLYAVLPRLNVKLKQLGLAANPAPSKATEATVDQSGEKSRAEPKHVFRPDGDGYFLRGFGEEGHVSANRVIGLHDIFRLVQSAGKPVPMLELVAGTGTERPVGDSQSIQPVANSQTRDDITAKRRGLKADIERADTELERTELQEELNRLETDAAKLFGLKGKPRDVNNPNNRLRPKIHGRIKDACKKLKTCKPKPFPMIADHFELTIGADGACMKYSPSIPNLLWQTESNK